MPLYIRHLCWLAVGTNLQQGMIIVMQLDYDSCAASAQGMKITYYPTPSQQGAVTLTQLNGVTLTFHNGHRRQWPV